MTGEEWDTHWHRIREDALTAGHTRDEAAELANRETAKQFGPHPEESTHA